MNGDDGLTTSPEMAAKVAEANKRSGEKAVNPLLTRRFINAYARMSGCREGDPAASCEHRFYARKALTELVGLVIEEQP